MKCNRKVYAVSNVLMQDIMTEGWEPRGIRCVEGLPADAVLVQVHAIYNREIWFVFEHPSFPESDTNWATHAYPRTAAKYSKDDPAPATVSTEGAAWASEVQR